MKEKEAIDERNLLDKKTLKSFLSNLFNANSKRDPNDVIKNINELRDHYKYSWHEVEHTFEHMYLYAIEIDLLEKLVLECDMPVDKALIFSSHCTVNGCPVLNKSAKLRYAKFVELMFKMANEQKIEFDTKSIVELTKLPIDTLHRLLEYQPKMTLILDEFFWQMNKAPQITPDYRKFIQCNKALIQEYIAKNPDSFNAEKIISVLNEEGIITNADSVVVHGEAAEYFE